MKWVLALSFLMSFSTFAQSRLERAMTCLKALEQTSSEDPYDFPKLKNGSYVFALMDTPTDASFYVVSPDGKDSKLCSTNKGYPTSGRYREEKPLNTYHYDLQGTNIIFSKLPDQKERNVFIDADQTKKNQLRPYCYDKLDSSVEIIVQNEVAKILSNLFDEIQSAGSGKEAFDATLIRDKLRECRNADYAAERSKVVALLDMIPSSGKIKSKKVTQGQKD